jgi:hypothetical protein
MVRFLAIFILCHCWFGRLEAKPAPSVFGFWLRPCLVKSMFVVALIHRLLLFLQYFISINCSCSSPNSWLNTQRICAKSNEFDPRKE